MRNLMINVLLLVCGSVCQAQVDELRAKAIAETVTRQGADYSASKLLRAHRREDLEDDLFRFQIKAPGKIAKAAYFFEVLDEGYFVLSPSEAVYVDSTDGHLVHLVAVSTISGESYLLSGFKSAASEFNRLASEANVRITSIKDAEVYATLCFTAISDPSSSRIVFGRRQLKHKIEDYFYSNYGEKKAADFYRRWWAGFSTTHDKVPFDILAMENAPGYETSIGAISGSASRIPQLDSWTFQVSLSGKCDIKAIKTIFPSGRLLGNLSNMKRNHSSRKRQGY